mgnify:CR=1 FL=1
MKIRLPQFTKNFYFIFGICFLIWMLFLDTNDLISQFKLSRKINQLEAEKEYYSRKIEEVKKEKAELFSNQYLLEKFAREKYLMKKPEEDLYVIVPE